MTAPSRRLAWATAVREEIDDLHLFFQEWFLGERPDTDVEFSRVERALGESFAIVSPTGTVMERDAIVPWLRDAHGSRAGETFRIWIRGVHVREESGSRLLASYEEWQETDDGVTARLSSAWFATQGDAGNGGGGLRWLHVHETWRPGRSPQDLGD